MLVATMIWMPLLLLSSAVPTLMSPPIAGLTAKELHDTFDQARATTRHEAIDIPEARGTPVHAVVDGVVAKLFLSKPGGNTIYQFDDSGTFCYYYAHLDRYASGIRDGVHVLSGQVIGYVGSSGNADPSAPHLHFAIFQLGPERKWWQGMAVNPYPVLLRLLRLYREHDPKSSAQ